MTSNSLILKPYEFNGQSLEVPFTDTAFFNATVAAKPFGKEPHAWLRSKEAQEYLEAFRKIHGTEQKQLVITKRGGEPTEQGTWLHPDLGVPFARWLNPEFAVWADMQIKGILQSHYIHPRFRPEKTRKALPGGLTLEQQDAVKALVKSRVEILPHGQQAKAAITCWSSIKSKFGVTYKEVPAASFAEVLSLVVRLPLDQEPPKALPFELHFPLESAAPPAGETGLAYYAFAQAKGWIDPGWELLMKLKAAGFNVDGPIYSHQAKIHVMTAFYNGLVGKAVENLNIACASLAYAPVYLR